MRQSSSSIVKWVTWRWLEEKRANARNQRCSCAYRDEMCPLCIESWSGVETFDPDVDDTRAWWMYEQGGGGPRETA